MTSPVAQCFCILTFPSVALLGLSMGKWPAIGASVFSTDQYSPDLAITDFYLFENLKRQVPGRTLDIEDNVLEMVTEILNKSPKDEVKNAFLHWKERCQ
jgi:hypothetical protein